MAPQDTMPADASYADHPVLTVIRESIPHLVATSAFESLIMVVEDHRATEGGVLAVLFGYYLPGRGPAGARAGVDAFMANLGMYPADPAHEEADCPPDGWVQLLALTIRMPLPDDEDDEDDGWWGLGPIECPAGRRVEVLHAVRGGMPRGTAGTA